MSLGMLTISGNFNSDDITSVKPFPIIFGKNAIYRLVHRVPNNRNHNAHISSVSEERTRLQVLDSGGSLTATTFPNDRRGKREAINEAGEGGKQSKKPVCANDIADSLAEDDIEDDKLYRRHETDQS
jgi:hypothetical protein